MDILHQFRRYITKPHVRPWAMMPPILVLLICLPLLRPLRHPSLPEISNDELARLATIQSLVEQRTLAIDQSNFQPTPPDAGVIVRRNNKTYAAQPPTLAVLLAGPAWIMQQCGLTLRKNPLLAAYFLTLLGATLPVAGVEIIIYRMGRTFELSRKKRRAARRRRGLRRRTGELRDGRSTPPPRRHAGSCSPPPASSTSRSRRPAVTSGWLAIAGLSAAFAAAILPYAAIFLLLFACAIPFMRWHWSNARWRPLSLPPRRRRPALSPRRTQSTNHRRLPAAEFHRDSIAAISTPPSPPPLHHRLRPMTPTKSRRPSGGTRLASGWRGSPTPCWASTVSSAIFPW